MKHALLAALVAAGLACAPAARAQVFGQYVPADILPPNGHLVGAYVDFGPDVVGLTGQLRLSFFPNLDFGFQGGVARLESGSDSKTVVRLGADLRGGVLRVSKGRILDLSLGAAIGVTASDNYDVLSLGPEVVISRSFGFSKESAVVPYVGAVMAFNNVDLKDDSSSDFSVPLRPGVEVRVMPGLRITGEFELRLWSDDNYQDKTSFTIGVNAPF